MTRERVAKASQIVASVTCNRVTQRSRSRRAGGDQLRHADKDEPGQLDQKPVIGVSSRLRQEPLFGLLAQLQSDSNSAIQLGFQATAHSLRLRTWPLDLRFDK
jgi:hypothetical protein